MFAIQRQGARKPRTNGLTLTRVVALAVIGVLIAGLGYLRFAADSGAISVPEGAKAGEVFLESCTYATEGGDSQAECGTLVVPEVQSDPESRLIALPVIRIRAQSGDPAEPVFYLEGGPGITNINFPQASRFGKNRDVVLVGYRGVDGSVRLDCPEVSSAHKRSADAITEESSRAYGNALRACADRLTEQGVDLAGYGLAQRVDDLEAARRAFGYDRVNLLSQSAGTRTAQIYAWRFPESVHRSVMIGVNPPGHFVWDTQTTDEQMGRYGALCAQDAGCSARTDDLAASVRQAAREMPDRWLTLPIQPGNVGVASFYGLMESTFTGAQPSAAMTFDGWLAATEGDASGLWFQSLLVDVLVADAFVWGEYASAAMLDAQAAREYFGSQGQDRESFGFAGSAFAWGAGGEMADAWPPAPDEDAYSRARMSAVETLLIGGALDLSTPPQVATKELLPYLSNGREVVLPWLGHTLSFFAEQPEAGSRLINTFFDSGRVDDSFYEPQSVDFTPDTTLTGLAKWIATIMAGVALLAVLSLLAIARRVRTRSGIGQTSAAVVRSIYPLVLGVGGWFLGSLAVMTTMPGVPLDDEFTVAISVGTPIGIGIALAWVHREWSPATKVAGLAAATGSAMIGAWLGFHATEGILALFTAIAGAAVGSNLTLILLDIARASSPTVAVRSAVETEPPVSVVP